MDTTTTTASTSNPSPFTNKKLEATTFALTAMEIDDSIAMLDTFFDPEESFADLPDDGVDESLLCELENFDDCTDAFSSTTTFPEPASVSTPATSIPAPVAAPLHSSQTFHSCADLTATEERLAAMMRKSALSRAQIQQSAAANRAINNASTAMTAPTQQQQQQQQAAMTSVQIPPIPAGATLKPQTVMAASGFLTGKRSTLTNALEQSRKQLQQYMAMVNQQSQMQM